MLTVRVDRVGPSSRHVSLLRRSVSALLLASAAACPIDAAAQAARPAAQATQVQQRTVPRVIGLELEQARSRMREAGFESETIPGDGSSGGRREVFNTEPKADQRFPVLALPRVKLFHRQMPGDDVQPPPKMPSLLGMTCDEARQRLVSQKRRLASCEVGSATGRFPAGRVNRQEPSSNSDMSPSTVARAWTEPATQPETTRVPEVRQLRVKEAVQRIESASLRAEFSSGQFDNWHWVDDQRPGANTTVARGSSVRLTLVAKYVVPDLNGATCDVARTRVADAGLSGLSCQMEMSAGSPLPPPNRIHRQDPPRGTVMSAARNVTAWVQPVTVTVPDVVGLLEGAANARLTQLRLQPQPFGPSANTGRQVVAQTPRGGTVVQPGSSVRIDLQLTVPLLKGLDCDTARARGHEHGFMDTSCELQRAGTKEPINRVFEQKPSAQTLLATAQKLVAYVAEPVVVPDVVGRALPTALATLRQAGLEGNADATDGDREVRSQEPQRGALVAPGSTVNLTTNRFALVPEVTGLTLAEADQQIRGRDFIPADDVGTGSTNDRRVREQSPKAGTRRMVGSRVQLVTYREVLIPDVIGLRLPEAETRLRQAGLAAKPDQGGPLSDREVRAQAPSGGERAPEGSEVALRTVRLVVVPKLTGLSHADARSAASAAGLQLNECAVESRGLPLFLLGTVTVTSQTPGDSRTVDEGSVVTCVGNASVMPLITLTSVLTLCAGALLWMRSHRFDKLAQLAALGWRVTPGAPPLVALRLAEDSVTAPEIVWRHENSEPLVLLRGAEALQGNHDDQHR